MAVTADPKQRWKGPTLAFVGVMLVSPDPMLLRLAAANGGTRWAIVCGKNLMMLPIFSIFAYMMLHGKLDKVRASVCGPGM